MKNANQNVESKYTPDEVAISVTPEELFLKRRFFLKHSLWSAFFIYQISQFAKFAEAGIIAKFNQKKFKSLPEFQKLRENDTLTKEEIATSYNNFYEFSLDKYEPKKLTESWDLDYDNWTVEIAGLVKEPKKYKIADLVDLAGGQLEERSYRFRCVEAWSMVVPWVGFSLGQLIEKLNPKPEAKYVKFYSLADSKKMPNIKKMPQYPWPYTEGLTLEEAKHPLTLLATGMYQKPLPKQNGAPIRLVVPWKYGFKSIKSIVKIEFTDKQPTTLWNELAPNEYGFYANVNPDVPHPRWSQASERILDTSFLPKRKPTLLFNGYEKEVASLYKGLDLKKNY